MVGVGHSNEDTATSGPSPVYSGFDLVMIGTSAGGIRALQAIFSKLPLDFPAPIVVAQHMADGPSVLVDILRCRTKLDVHWVTEGAYLQPATVHVCPPGFHVTISADGRMHLSPLAKVRFVRPSIDMFFASGAEAFNKRVIGVVLTGSGSDGALGVAQIKRQGGRVIVQDQGSFAFGMPQATLVTASFDFMLPLEIIPKALVSLVMVEGAASMMEVFDVPYFDLEGNLLEV